MHQANLGKTNFWLQHTIACLPAMQRRGLASLLAAPTIGLQITCFIGTTATFMT